MSASFTPGHFQDLLRLTRAHWRGWNISLFVDRASAPTAEARPVLAADWEIALRWLPTACPELNVMDCLWRHVKDDVIANGPTPDLEASVNSAISYLDSLTAHQRLVKAGVFSDNFWLANVRNALLSK